ncbi:MAG TPA: hypothetical protein VEL28_17130 [Candidatus Binatia bacterium]|nr:hypothetical protein [Candidatus Binatia bacterium]
MNLLQAQPAGQTFRPSQDTLEAVELVLAGASDSTPNADVTITVRENDFAGAIVGSVTETVALGLLSEQRYLFEFAAPLTVVPDATYMLDIDVSNNAVLIPYGSCGYDRGAASFTGNDDPQYDFVFATFGPCGNGEPDAGEICDDGVFADPCCEFPSCQYASADTECDFDDNECTDDHCDGAGSCSASDVPEGAACAQDADPCMTESCDGAGACVSAADAAAGTPCTGSDLCSVYECDGLGQCAGSVEPAEDCSVAEKAQLLMIDSAKPGKDKVKFKWKKGPFFLPQIGNPLSETDYALCVYDAASLVTSATLAPTMEWIPGIDYLSYENKDGSAVGVTAARIQLERSFDVATVSMSLGGANYNLDLPILPTPVIAQMRTEAGGCWGAQWAADEVKKNDGKKFSSKEKNELP